MAKWVPPAKVEEVTKTQRFSGALRAPGCVLWEGSEIPLSAVAWVRTAGRDTPPPSSALLG